MQMAEEVCRREREEGLHRLTDFQPTSPRRADAGRRMLIITQQCDSTCRPAFPHPRPWYLGPFRQASECASRDLAWSIVASTRGPRVGPILLQVFTVVMAWASA